MIITNNRYIHEIADEAWELLLEDSDDPPVFRRGLEFVELRPDTKDRIAVVTVTPAALRDTLDRRVEFVKKSEGRRGPKYHPDAPRSCKLPAPSSSLSQS